MWRHPRPRPHVEILASADRLHELIPPADGTLGGGANGIDSDDVEAGNPGGATFMGDFFGQVAEIKLTIENANAKIAELEKKQDAALTDVYGGGEFKQEIEDLTNDTNHLSTQVRNELKGLDEALKQQKASDPMAEQTSDFKIRRNMHATLTNKFVEIMQERQDWQTKYKHKCQGRLKRQFKIVKPDATQEEVDAMLERGGDHIFTDHMLASRNAQARAALDHIMEVEMEEKRRIQTMRLKQEAQELVQFCDLSRSVESRKGLLDSIEYSVSQSLMAPAVVSGDGHLNLSARWLGQAEVSELVHCLATDASPTVTSINCTRNKFGEEGLAVLLKAIEGTPVRSLCGLVEGQTIADFSGQNLKPFDMKILAAEFESHGFITALTSINCLANKFGDEGLATLLTAIEGTSVRSLCGLIEGQMAADFSGQNLGPLDYKIIAAEFEFHGFIAVVEELTVDSTGNMRDRRTYTLSAGAKKIDLSQKNLGSADATLLTAWLQRPEVNAALTSINCLKNNFGDNDLAPLLTAIEGTSVRSLCGLTEGQTAADFSGQNLGPIDCKIIAAEYGFRGAIAAVARLVLNDNPITNHGKDLSSLTTLCDVLPTLEIPISLELANCNLKVAELNELARAVDAGAAVTSLCCANNPGMVGELDGSGRLETPDVHADVFKQLTDSLKMSNATEADFSSCGIGPVALGHLSEWVRDATAAVSSLAISGNFIFGTKVESAGTARVRLLGAGTEKKNVHDVDKDQSGWNNLCEQLKGSNITSFTASDIGMGPVALLTLATSLPAAVARLVLNGNMITSSSQDCPGNHGLEQAHGPELSGLISLCDALPVLKNPIVLGLAHCGLSADSANLLLVHVEEAIGAGAIDDIDLSGCRVEPTVSAQVLSAASDASRRRLRTAQVLAFSSALHDRLGAATAVCELVDNGAVDILRIVSSIVHSRQGHEALCSALARRHPWYEVAVRGLISEGVPHL